MRQSPAVLGHDSVDLVFAVPMASEIQCEAAWLGQPFGVWPVRTEQDVFGADEVLQLSQVVLIEGCDPHMLT